MNEVEGLSQKDWNDAINFMGSSINNFTNGFMFAMHFGVFFFAVVVILIILFSIANWQLERQIRKQGKQLPPKNIKFKPKKYKDLN